MPDNDLLHTLVVRIAGQDEKGLAVRRELGAREGLLRAWYEGLLRWVRTRFKKNPVNWMSGYVGPAAYGWYESGGLLLPYCAPPVTPEWRERIHSQHPASGSGR